MIVTPRRAAIITTLFFIAGCSGGTPSQSPSLGSPSANAFVHRGVPFAPPVLRGLVPKKSGKYKTKKSLVFVGDQGTLAVSVYETAKLSTNPSPIAMIHVAAGCPYGLAADKKGTLYVADNCPSGSFTGDIEEYAKGSTKLKTTITDGISDPLGAAIDAEGNLYVSNYPAAITVYAPGSTSPSETITGGGMVDPFGLALDGSGDLFIADFGADAVFEVKAGTTTVQNLNLSGLGEPLGLAFDLSSGYLWESDGSGDAINVYSLGTSSSPIETIPGNGFPYAIATENVGKPLGEVVESDLDARAVYAYKPDSYSSYAALTNGIETPTGLLITKP